jgi:hypothetical protein
VSVAIRLRRNTGRISYLSLLLGAVVTPIIHLLWDLIPDLTSYGNVEYELSVLAALGTVGCLGYLVARAYQNSGGLFNVRTFLPGTPASDARPHSRLSVESADWPLLVALLFGPFLVLLAGLGGWV